MANQEQLEILKQGVDIWNKWRKNNPSTKIDLFGANLREANLEIINLQAADLREADLGMSNLLFAELRNANLEGANLRRTNLSGAGLQKANLNFSNLSFAILRSTNLTDASIRNAFLSETIFSGAVLREINISNALVGDTVFASVDLSQSHGINDVYHESPSSIDFNTIRYSKGKIPEVFLQGCGLSDVDIEYAKLAKPDLTNDEITEIQYRIYELRATQALQISPLFISYSHADNEFVNLLDSSLTEKGVRFWRDIHDAKAGRFETQIDRAIRQNPTVLLVLSKNSIKSDWVEHEVRKARELEKEFGRDALCPVALDDSWKSSSWPERVMEQIMEYNILDFSGWQEKSTFDRQFAKLLSGLEIFYKKPAT